MAHKRFHLWQLILVTLCLVPLVFVGGISWVLYKARHPKQLSFAQVQQLLIGDTPTVTHRIVGWGSERYGFDDGSDWIEFTTDASGLKALLESRPFVQIPAERELGAVDWTLNPEEWRGLHVRYEDDSDFDRLGTTYYLWTQNRKEDVRALIARTHQ